MSAVQRGGVVQAFGTGHSQAFAMEVAGRAGGLIPTHAIVLRDVVLRGSRDVSVLQGGTLERDESVADELYELYSFDPADLFVIASNSGVNGSIVGLALRAKADGHPVIAVTSLEHTNAVAPKHSSGKRLSEIADLVIDNRAPYGDATIDLGDGLAAGAVSSITAAYIAQLLTLGTASDCETRARSLRSTSRPTSREVTRTTTHSRRGTASASPGSPDPNDRQRRLWTRAQHPAPPVSRDHHERHPTMSRDNAPFDRRTLLRGALATAALVPLGGALASCGGSSPSAGGGSGSSAATTATNPFGLAKDSSVDAVIFNGGYGYDYVKFAADQVNEAAGLLGRHDQGVAVDPDRPAAAASLRRWQPARPDRQLR